MTCYKYQGSYDGCCHFILIIDILLTFPIPFTPEDFDLKLLTDFAEFSSPTNWTGAAIVWASIDTNAAILAQVVCALIDSCR